MKILSFDCHIPGWCSFRIPHSINTHLTYPAPPPTTVYGMIANALGLWQDDYSLMAQMKTGIRILKPGSLVETYSHWMKWNPPKNSMTTTIMKQKLIQPVYRIYVSAEESLLNQIYQALHQPSRILYLGDSDDLVELSEMHLQTATKSESKQLNSVIPSEMVSGDSIINQVSVVRWPVQFDQNKRAFSIQYELVYIAENIVLSDPVPCWRLSHTQDFILLGGMEESHVVSQTSS